MLVLLQIVPPVPISADTASSSAASLIEPPKLEPAEQLADHLNVICLAMLPPRPLPPRLLPCDVPKPFAPTNISAFIGGRADWLPPGKEDGFKLDENDRRLVAPAFEGASSRAIAPLQVLASEDGVGVVSKKFNLIQSIFTPRMYNSDACSFFITNDVTLRAFDIDWSRACGGRIDDFNDWSADISERAKGEAAADEVDGGSRPGSAQTSKGGEGDNRLLAIVHDVLKANRKLVQRLFAYYGSLDGQLHKMTSKGFFTLMAEANITSKALPTSVLGQVFDAANEEENFESRDSDGNLKQISFENWLANQANEDDSLSRFEFFRVIVGIARLK